MKKILLISCLLLSCFMDNAHAETQPYVKISAGLDKATIKGKIPAMDMSKSSDENDVNYKAAIGVSVDDAFEFEVGYNTRKFDLSNHQRVQADTISLDANFLFLPETKFRPYVGVGVNYTQLEYKFNYKSFEEKMKDDDISFAARGGVRMDFNDHVALDLFAQYNFKSEFGKTVANTNVKADYDDLLLNLGVVFKF